MPFLPVNKMKLKVLLLKVPVIHLKKMYLCALSNISKRARRGGNNGLRGHGLVGLVFMDVVVLVFVDVVVFVFVVVLFVDVELMQTNFPKLPGRRSEKTSSLVSKNSHLQRLKDSK